MITIPIIVANNMAAIFMNNLRLKRISKYDNCIIRDTEALQLYNIKNKKEEFSKIVIKDLLPYLEKLKFYTSHNNLTTVYDNLNNLKIKKNIFLVLSGATGGYSADKNMISYATNESIGHEFLHLASSKYDKENDVIFSGFKQQKGIACIGRGLNEGYTELLASKIYNKNNKITAYKKLVRIAELFQLFFDDPKEMENYYFNHNLPGLIHYMEQFAPKDEIIKLILDVDNIYFFDDIILSSLSTYDYLKIQLKLYEWFISKNNSTEKLMVFENILCRNKIIELSLKNQKVKLCRECSHMLKNQKDNYDKFNSKV